MYGIFYDKLGTAFDSAVRSIKVQSSNNILIGGDFTTLNGTIVNRLVKLDSYGNLNSAFKSTIGTAFNSSVRCLHAFSDGTILAVGNFTNFNGSSCGRAIKLNDDGSLYSAFNSNIGSGFNAVVNYSHEQADGKLLIGGNFTSFNGNTRNFLVRLNSDGTEDSVFYSNMSNCITGEVRAIKTQYDDKVLVGGDFGLLKLNADGSQDLGFKSRLGAFSYIVYSIATQADGRILVGTSKGLIRLNSNGSQDMPYSSILGSNFNGSVRCIAVQVDNKVMIGGDFTSFNGKTRNRIIRLNETGYEDVDLYNNIALGADEAVYAIHIQINSKMLIGGNFTSLNGNTRNYINRLTYKGLDDPTEPMIGETVVSGSYGITLSESGVNVDFSGQNIEEYVDDQAALKVNKAGDSMTGLLTLSGDPTSSYNAATKNYVDNGLSTKLSLSGGTMTGKITLDGNPTAANHAANRTYVDNGLSTKLSLSGGTMTGDINAGNNDIKNVDHLVIGTATAGTTAKLEILGTIKGRSIVSSYSDTLNILANSSSEAGIAVNPNGTMVLVSEASDGCIQIQKNVTDETTRAITFSRSTHIHGAIDMEVNYDVFGNAYYDVTYGTFSGFHWSQLAEGDTKDLLLGTVMDTVDDLCFWQNDPNRTLAKSKISDKKASKRVYGVFSCLDASSEDGSKDIKIVSLGIGLCRMSASASVRNGDLLESNGDGCAIVQQDDIIRSSTIGKVTSSKKAHIYSDGSYLIPVVLYCG
mgnify:FL=1